LIPFACVPKASNHKPLCPLWNNDKVKTINTCSTLSNYDKNIGSFFVAAFLYAQPVRMNVLPGKFNA
jgi:hypothetical protein